jgi:hypothetical protein
VVRCAGRAEKNQSIIANKCAFKKGEKRKNHGGKRPGAGRKTKAEAELTDSGTQIVNKIEAAADKLITIRASIFLRTELWGRAKV